jgi:hypothetical protein
MSAFRYPNKNSNIIPIKTTQTAQHPELSNTRISLDATSSILCARFEPRSGDPWIREMGCVMHALQLHIHHQRRTPALVIATLSQIAVCRSFIPTRSRIRCD